jgi:carbamoyl-phosphate synthase large subunit
MITGVGGGVGQSILKCLQDTPYRLIGVDSEPLGTGLYTAAKAYQVPYASHPTYIDRMVSICKKEKCNLVFPGQDAELPVLSHYSQRFTEEGITLVVSKEDVVQIADDKLLTYQFLSRHGFDVPQTLPLTEDVLNNLLFPFIIKPQKGGARSRGVFIIKDENEFRWRASIVEANNYVAQEYISGDEYTCGSINFDGCCHGTIVMRRILRDGDTYKAFVVKNPVIESYVKAVAEKIKPFGACNFQLRLKEGKPHIFEINARCSGTTYSRALAGFNEPLMIAEYLIDQKQPVYDIREISIFRYWKELVVENSRIEIMQKSGTLSGNGSKL